MLKMLSLLKEIVEGFSYEESETINMPKLEGDESAEQSGQGLKILTPDQMLSRLPITLAQLKAGNNSEKLKNETRKLLYSLYRSKKLTKQLYKKFDRYYLQMKTIFMNSENSKTNVPHTFKLN